MNSPLRPRGRHPARVYWVRRVLVAATALSMVYAVAQLATGGSEEPPAAAPAAAKPTSDKTPKTVEPVPYGPVGIRAKRAGKTPAAAPLAEPDGPCDIEDITVTPVIAAETAGREVPIGLELTGIAPACTFEVGPATLAVRVTRGTARIWSSQQCPASVEKAELVVRSATPTPYAVTWSGRRSDDSCSRTTSWALPGAYHVIAAAIGSEPAEKKFALTEPPRPVVTKTVPPKPGKKAAEKKASSGSNRR